MALLSHCPQLLIYLYFPIKKKKKNHENTTKKKKKKNSVMYMFGNKLPNIISKFLENAC